MTVSTNKSPPTVNPFQNDFLFIIYFIERLPKIRDTKIANTKSVINPANNPTTKLIFLFIFLSFSVSNINSTIDFIKCYTPYALVLITANVAPRSIALSHYPTFAMRKQRRTKLRLTDVQSHALVLGIVGKRFFFSD